MGKPFCDLTGKRFGRWTVESQADDYIIRYTKNGKQITGRYTQWNCKCDCGAMKTVLGSNLTCGKSKSCGCFRDETQRNRTKNGKETIKFRSLSTEPSLEEMLRVMLGEEYDSIPEEERKDRAIKNVFYNCWFKFVRDEQSVVRRYKKLHPHCDICGIKCETELHHIRPVAEYGGNEPENIMWLCHDCHSKIEKEKKCKK